jgi:hypothetical protein
VVTAATTTTGENGVRERAARRWRESPNARPVAFLAVLPILVFAVPAATGHPPISFDNLLQNFPLRVLSGSLIRQGHLPLWNPTIWSGSPLLGGLNAGSFYPGTLLFAVLPGVLAWVLNLIGVYWAAGIGMYALLRQYSLRPTACLLAAVTYQFGGAMTGQLVHLGIIQGMGWMPLIVLAELRLSWAVLGTGPSTEYRSGPTERTSPWPWVTLLGTLIGLIFLTGEPRSMAETEIVASVVLGWLVVRSYPGAGVDLVRRARCVAYGVLAAGWGVVIGASQLLPGRSFILASQRASENYAFFGLGSLRPSWSILLLVQNLFGGNGILGQPMFSIGYNLPEVTGYVGILPLVAFLVLAVRSIGRGSDPRARDWRLWLFLAPLGLALSLGTFTPLGHLFAEIPFYNKVRLDSRSLAIVDLGLAVLFGFWLDLFLAGEWRERVSRPARWLREVAVPMVFPVAGFAAAAVACAIPATVLVAFGANPIDSPDRRVWMAAQAAVALGAGLVVFAWRRWTPTSARRLLTAVVAADLGLFALTSSTGMFAGGQPEPTRAEAAAVVGTNGRFAIVNAPNIDELSSISEPDINGLTNLDSVQGYGSIVSGHYDDVTGTHALSSLDPCALARGVFVQLRLATVLVRPHALIRPVVPHIAPHAPPACAGAPSAGTPSARTFYFGEDLTLASVELVGSARAFPSVAVVSASDTTRNPAERVVKTPTGWSVRFAVPQLAAGIVVHGPARAIADTSSVTATSGIRYALTGSFQDALGQSSWHFRGLWGGYARFETTKLAPRVAVRGVPSASAHRVSTTPWGTETDSVDTPVSATVVRSEAYLAGWRVRAVPAGGGPALTLRVFPVGLVQGVRVPAGRWTLTFNYWPSGLSLGGIASVLGVVGVLAVTGVRLRRRRRRSGRSSPAIGN